jgi:acetyl/propionyl-CoA carboxylase alpha subunit
MIKRLLVANRGEIATNRTDCRTVYLYIAEFGVNVLICRR